MKILIAIDGSPSSLRALQYVLDHADMFGRAPDLTLVNVHLPIPSARAKAWVGQDIVNAYYAEEADAALADALALLEARGIKASVLKSVGDPGHEIAKAGAAHDLVVMGTHGRTALANLVMGSVATRAVAESATPVLLVK